MAGTFELFSDDEDMGVRFRLTAPDGMVMAVSPSFPDKEAAVAAIQAVREYAGTGHITDLCPEIPSPAKQRQRRPRTATARSVLRACLDVS